MGRTAFESEELAGAPCGSEKTGQRRFFASAQVRSKVFLQPFFAEKRVALELEQAPECVEARKKAARRIRGVGECP